MILRSATESRLFHGKRKADETSAGFEHPEVMVPHHPEHHDLLHWHHPKHWRGLVVSTTVAVVVLFGGGLLGSHSLFKDRLLPGVSVNSISLGGKSQSEAESTLQNAANKLSYTIELNDKKLHPTASELGIRFNVSATASEAASFGSGSLFDIFKSQSFDLKVEVDQVRLENYLANKVNKVSKPPADARLSVDNGEVAIAKEVNGQGFGVDAKTARLALLAAAQKGQNATLKASPYDVQPAITSVGLAAVKSRTEQILNSPVKLSVEKQNIVPTKAQIGTWLLINANAQAKTYDVAIDAVRVSNYLDAVAKPFVKPPRSKVVVSQDDGSERTVNEGAPGTDITGKAEVAAELAKALNSKQPYNRALPISYAAPGTISAGDWAKWIDVDLTNKRMYTYEHADVTRTFLVTAGAAATPTVKGQFAIKTKVAKQDMRGFNANGTTYYQPNVQYINYFYQDYAIHGNYWRPASVFGSTNTSHGCVGITNTDAKWVYDWASVGTPVIVHS